MIVKPLDLQKPILSSGQGGYEDEDRKVQLGNLGMEQSEFMFTDFPEMRMG